MSRESDGGVPFNPNTVSIFNPLPDDFDGMITQDGFVMGTQDENYMEPQEG